MTDHVSGETLNFQLPLSLRAQGLSFSGSLEKVVYFDPETGQSWLDVKLDQYKIHVLVSCKHPPLVPGVHLRLELEKPPSQDIKQPIDGVIREVSSPRSSRTTKKFLKSGALGALGPQLAGEIAKTFSENLFEVLERAPQQLSEVKGVGRKKQEQFVAAWKHYKSQTELAGFLFAEELPLEWAQRIADVESLRSKPYQCLREGDLDFKLVDRFALKMGFAVDSLERARAALWAGVSADYKNGNCASPEAKLLEETARVCALSSDLLEEALELELLDDELVEETIDGVACVYLRRVWELERRVAQLLLGFVHKQPPWGWIDFHKTMSWSQNILNLRLAPLQKEAIETALSSALTVITGGPGTGKTTLIRALVTILQTQFAPFALCSPTGRGAQRLSETTGAPAQTIHRLLKYDGGAFHYNETNPLKVDLVLVDEASMVDLSLMSHLLAALPPQAALILVGDADQIPPVGAGHILKSLIDSERFTVVKLTDIFRQSDTSSIKTNARRINEGMMPLGETSGDFHYIPVASSEAAKEVVKELILDVIPNRYGIQDPAQVQVLAPMNRGGLGTRELNLELQRLLVGVEPGRLDGRGFQKHDKIMVVKNDYRKAVFNGDVGFITRIDPFLQLLEVQIDRRLVEFAFDELDKLTLAYAISIHKSQGSEYRAVIVLVGHEHLPMAQRHLIYTAVTRGKEHVFLVADPAALKIAVESDENNRRWQKLTELLKAV